MDGSSTKKKERSNFLSLEERIQQYNDQMRLYEKKRQPVPDELLIEFQKLYNEGMLQGKTFVRNTDAPYIYLEDFTALANAIHLQDILFDPHALGRVPLDQPLISFIGGGARNTTGLKDKVLLLKSPPKNKKQYIIIKGESFGGKHHWYKALFSVNLESQRQLSKVIFDGITEHLKDKLKIKKLREENGFSDKKYNNLKFYELKYSFEEIEKLITARLYEIYSTKTFTRSIRKSVKKRLASISSSFTTGGIINENFAIYYVKMPQIIEGLLFNNQFSLTGLSSNDIASQIIRIILEKAITLIFSDNKSNLINIFKDISDNRNYHSNQNGIHIANRSELTRSGQLKCWYEGCPEAWMNVVTQCIFENISFRKALNLNVNGEISSTYTGLGKRRKGNQPSGFPDVCTLDKTGKVIDIIQIKQVGYNKPHEPADLLRDITKTAGWFNNKGIKSALNVFVFESTDISRLNMNKKYGYDNVLIIGYWPLIEGINRFGEAVEAARICKNIVNTSKLASMDLSNDINNFENVSNMLKEKWVLPKGIELDGLEPISINLLEKIINEANRHHDSKTFYAGMIQLLVFYIRSDKKKNGPGRI